MLQDVIMSYPEVTVSGLKPSTMCVQLVKKTVISRPGMCKHIYMYTHIHYIPYMYIHTYIHIYIHTYIHTYFTYTYIHTTHTYIHTYIYTYIHTYIHVHTHTYIHTYIHTYLHTYIHTCTHTHAHGMYAYLFQLAVSINRSCLQWLWNSKSY